jgi:hypothetical protein
MTDKSQEESAAQDLNSKEYAPQMFEKFSWDWCHVCGHRSSNSVVIFYSANSEHALRKLSVEGKDKTIRICGNCAWKVAAMSGAPIPSNLIQG